MARSRRHPPRWFRVGLLCLLALLLAMLLWPVAKDSDPRLIKDIAPDKAETKHEVIAEQDSELTYEVFLQEKEESLKPLPLLKRPTKGMALIIDDVGYDIKALKRLLDLPFDVAISILPGAPNAKHAAELSHADGQVVMLHLPMEPDNPKYQAKMTDTFLRVNMNEQQIRQKVNENLDRIPYIQGVNNHMGSLLTTMQAPMRWVVEQCRARGLFFIDSKTAPRSVAADVAADMGIAWAERRIFLDHSVEPEALAASWRAALRCVERRGGCIVIGHPHAETIDFLEQHVSKDDRRHIRPVTELLYSKAE